MMSANTEWRWPLAMPTTCGFPNCKFRSRYRGHHDNRHFYRVPKKPAPLRERWLQAIGRTESTIVNQVHERRYSHLDYLYLSTSYLSDQVFGGILFGLRVFSLSTRLLAFRASISHDASGSCWTASGQAKVTVQQTTTPGAGADNPLCPCGELQTMNHQHWTPQDQNQHREQDIKPKDYKSVSRQGYCLRTWLNITGFQLHK